LKEQHDILNEFVGAPGSDRPPHMELPTENPDGPIISCKEDRFEAIVFHHFLPFPDVHDA
jgi:hypothetical protein